MSEVTISELYKDVEVNNSKYIRVVLRLTGCLVLYPGVVLLLVGSCLKGIQQYISCWLCPFSGLRFSEQVVTVQCLRL